MAIKIDVLQANHGDSILLSCTNQSETVNVLIDGGSPATFKYGPRSREKGHLCKKLEALKEKNQQIDLAILTHIDDDHIGGMLKAFECEGYLKGMVKRIWFNSSNSITEYFNHSPIPENEVLLDDGSPLTGVGQGKALDELLKELGCERPPILLAGQTLLVGPFTFKILSPTEDNLKELLCIWPTEETESLTSGRKNDHSERFETILKDDVFKEDKSTTNGSSIAFIVEVENRKMLFLGDAFDKTIISSLTLLGFNDSNKLRLDLTKISHHGSTHNTSPEFLKMIIADNYVISTNGGKHGLPDKKTIARILESNPTSIILFNYDNVVDSLTRIENDETILRRLVVLKKEIEF